MFNFLLDAGNYESRAVARFEKDNMIIDTASVSDGEHPYETGVCHPEYNDGKWVIVEAYDTKQDAQRGHDAWVAKMTSQTLPVALRDCCNAGIASLYDAVGGSLDFPRTI